MLLLTIKFSHIILLVPFVTLEIFPYNSNSVGRLQTTWFTVLSSGCCLT